MNINYANLLRGAKTFVVANSPRILTGFAVAGTVITLIETVKATMEACEIVVVETECNSLREHVKEEGVADTIKLVGKNYITPIGWATLTIAAVIGSHSISSHRAAVLAGAYAASESKLENLKKGIEEKLTPKQQEDLKDDLAKKTVSLHDKQNVTDTQQGETLFLEEYSGRYFRSSIDAVRRAEVYYNKDLLNEQWLSINSLYRHLGLPITRMGDDIGWENDDLVELEIRPILMDDGETCMVLDYNIEPRPFNWRS